MVGHVGSSAGSYLADPTSPMPSHCASIVATGTVRVNISQKVLTSMGKKKKKFFSVLCYNSVFVFTIIYGLALDVITCSWVLNNSFPCIKLWFKKATIRIFESNTCSNSRLTLSFKTKNSSYFSASVCHKVN